MNHQTSNNQNRKRTHAGARESNEWTMQDFSLDQLVLPAQDKTRQDLERPNREFEKNVMG